MNGKIKELKKDRYKSLLKRKNMLNNCIKKEILFKNSIKKLR